MGSSFEEAVERIRVIDFNKDECRKSSVSNLFTEYRRRMSVFLRYTSNGHSTRRYFIVRAAQEIGKQLDNDKLLDNLKLCPNISEVNYHFVKHICAVFLEWSTLLDDGDATALRFSDVYEPLIKFIEIGGRFRKEHGFVEVPKYSIHEYDNFKLADLQPIDISEEALKMYDKTDIIY